MARKIPKWEVVEIPAYFVVDSDYLRVAIEEKGVRISYADHPNSGYLDVKGAQVLKAFLEAFLRDKGIEEGGNDGT